MGERDFRGAPIASHTDLSLDQLDAYYRGAQPLSFLHPDLERQVNNRVRPLVINWPRLVVDSIADRLDVEGFRLAGASSSDADLWRIWQANDLDERSSLVHTDALALRRSFVLVWEGEDPKTPLITVESALQMSVEYDATGRVVQATKVWREGDTDYRTTYDRAYVVREARPSASYDAQWTLRGAPIANPYGVVPVEPFVNRPTLLRPHGESEMTDVIPLADAINKLGTDMMTSAEYHAMPRRWATGVDLGTTDAAADRTSAKIRERWEEARASKVWVSDKADVKFGQFAEASLDNFRTAMDALTARAAAISGLPPHYFGQAGENPASADALRASESSLVKRVHRKQRAFGGSWERVMRLAALIRDGGSADPSLLSLETIWRDAETPTIAQAMDAAVKGVVGGVIDSRQAQEDLGYTPVQMDRMAERGVLAPPSTP